MKTLNLISAKVSRGTCATITEYVYTNRAEISNELKMFYQDVKGLIELQLSKPLVRRMTMSEILERAYNIEQYVLASGACSVETEFVSL